MKKRKKIAYSIILLLILTIVCASEPLTASADTHGHSYFYTTNWYTPNNSTYGYEADTIDLAYEQIQGLMDQQHYYRYWWYEWPFYFYQMDDVYTNHDYSDSTSEATVTSHITSMAQGDYFSTDLYVGHMKNIGLGSKVFNDTFASGDLSNWNATCGNVYVQNQEMVGITTTESRMAQAGVEIDESSMIRATANIYFNDLNVPQGADSRLELLQLNAGTNGGWEYSATVSVNNPEGTPVWTVEIYEGETAYRFYASVNRAPTEGMLYRIDLTRDLANGQAQLYVTYLANETCYLAASGSHIMTRNTEWVATGIVYQSESGTNQVTVDNVNVYSGATTFGFKGHTDYPWDADPADGANPTMDTDIRSETSSYGSNERFVFLWVCDNAYVEGDSSYGMAYAWSNGAISNDGYNDGYQHPDGSGYAFISFEGASPWLIDWMGTYGSGEIPNIYKHWLVFFYCAALYGYNVYTINESLDLASVVTDFDDFDSAPFAFPNSGAWVPWPYEIGPGNGTYQGLMRVYGDGNICLPQSNDLIDW